MANPTPVILNMPGYNPPGPTYTMPDDSENMGMPTASAYKIPPAVWPFVFIALAVLGLAYWME